MPNTSAHHINKIQITPHAEWAQKFWDGLVPYKNKIVEHVYFRELQNGTLSIERARRGLIDFYPLVENFPKYMALNVAKTKPGAKAGHAEAKFWLMQNMKVEQKHADWWCDWAECIRLTREDLYCAKPSPLMDAINHFLWHVNTSGSMAEGIAATNLAVEWATGEWTIRILSGVKSYAERGLADITPRTMSWLNAHAIYDEKHPYEAMEVIKLTAATEEERQSAFEFAKRAMEYYLLALDDCYEPYSFRPRANLNGAVNGRQVTGVSARSACRL